jgi:hypothetical protein
MRMDLTGLWRRGRQGYKVESGSDDDLYHQVNAAHREWLTAQQYFQCVSEPDLVDYAVQSITAAEQKYTSLLRRVREQQGRSGEQE